MYSKEITKKANLILDFFKEYPKLKPSKIAKQTTDENQIEEIKKALNNISKRKPRVPNTQLDTMIPTVMKYAFNYESEEKINEAIIGHKDAMGAENFIGYVLESYIASVLEPLGWIWCENSIVKATDFIKKNPNGKWKAIQIKNRSNSENSSSNKIREGTPIQPWFRTFHQTTKQGETNWGKFPDTEARNCLSEDGFRCYVIKYLKSLK